MYDIIGDLHGHYNLLVSMLKELGYREEGKSFQHETRKVIFTGDYINRGPEIRKTVNLIRNMVENGNAYAVLGNHELNAILYSTLDKNGKFFRKHLSRYKLPLLKTLDEYSSRPGEYDEMIKWFRKLPFYLDLGEIRVVHGSWNPAHIATIEKYMAGEPKLKKSFLKEVITNPELNIAILELTKGVEFQLPKDLIIKDSKGISRRSFRIKWWESANGKTFNEISFSNRFKLPEYTIPKEIVPSVNHYPDDLPPVFFGHYCLEKEHLIIKDNLCCVDRCVVRSQTLTAYRWKGEKTLNPDNLVFIQ